MPYRHIKQFCNTSNRMQINTTFWLSAIQSDLTGNTLVLPSFTHLSYFSFNQLLKQTTYRHFQRIKPIFSFVQCGLPRKKVFHGALWKQLHPSTFWPNGLVYCGHQWADLHSHGHVNAHAGLCFVPVLSVSSPTSEPMSRRDFFTGGSWTVSFMDIWDSLCCLCMSLRCCHACALSARGTWGPQTGSKLRLLLTSPGSCFLFFCWDPLWMCSWSGL